MALILSTSTAIYLLYKTHNMDLTSGEEKFLRFPSGFSPSLEATTISRSQGLQYERNTIWVTGSGKASAQADEATVILGVETEKETASEASSSNAELMSAVINSLESLGLTEEDMRTVSYTIYPVYSKDDYKTIVGYRVINMIAVKITDMNLIGAVIDKATENGANRIQGVSFGLSDEKQSDLKREAYVAALKDAEEKASLIAEQLGVKITGVVSVSESVYQPYRPYYDFRYAVAGSESVSTPIIEGKLSISVTVQVVYSFE